MKKTILGLMFVLSACGFEGHDVKGGRGVFVCTSTQGRPELSFHTDTMKAQRLDLGGTGVVEFVDIGTGQTYRLHTTEDRDYNCERT